MVGEDHAGEAGRGRPVSFATTHWSVVLAAGRQDSAQAAQALEELCCAYWYPLYAYVRRRGHAPADAEDLVQGFILHLLNHRFFQAADPDKGRFRSYLLASLNHYLADVADQARRLKRGGGHRHLHGPAHDVLSGGGGMRDGERLNEGRGDQVMTLRQTNAASRPAFGFDCSKRSVSPHSWSTLLTPSPILALLLSALATPLPVAGAQGDAVSAPTPQGGMEVRDISHVSIRAKLLVMFAGDGVRPLDARGPGFFRPRKTPQ